MSMYKRAVIGKDRNGQEMRFESIKDAAAHVLAQPTNIIESCKDGKSTVRGWRFRYADERDYAVIATFPDGAERRFSSVKEASETTYISDSAIYFALQGKRTAAAGIRWRWEKERNAVEVSE